MASAYAALRSLKCTLETVNNLTRFSISFDKKQMESLLEKVNFLIEFLESFSHRSNEKSQDLENRMADAAYNTEDAIESHVADEITGEAENGLNLECFIEDLDVIKSDSMKIKRVSAVENCQSNSSVFIDLSSSTVIGKSNMVGFDDELLSIKDKLTGGKSSLLIIPIIGMGRIGKTTLAKNVYEDKLIVEHFDIRVWVTISQVYDVKRIFSEVLLSIQKHQMGDEISEDQLGEQIYKSLFGRKYLVILDNMWELEAWNKLQQLFPDNGNGSRIIVTTRNSHLATYFASDVHRLNFLNEDNSWNLFCTEVFGDKGCPVELREKGKKIANNCKGLPLSIVVIGGLLAKSVKTKHYWEYVANDLNSIANLEDDEQRTMKTLSLSYHSLPIHLKPCFLYMGAFPRGDSIESSEIIKLWVAEGFLKPIINKDLQVVGEQYLQDLFSRNLLINDDQYVPWRYFKIHDILRDLCLRECQSQKFLNVQCLSTLECLKSQRRISSHKNTPQREYAHQIFHAEDSASYLRSLLCYKESILDFFPLGNPKMLRVLDTVYGKGHCYVEDIVSLVNSQYITLFFDAYSNKVKLPSSLNLLWNLQFLKIDGKDYVAPLEIWKMTQLKHVNVSDIWLPDPPRGKTSMQENFVLENLHTLSTVINFRCTEEVVKRIPNINKLEIKGEFEEDYFKNLDGLSKLESLYCKFQPLRILSPTMFQAFPVLLKKLTLRNIEFDWKDLGHIGSLPYLEVLKLWSIMNCTTIWEPIEGEYSRLKYLYIYECDLVEGR